jgi:hypothetical protein
LLGEEKSLADYAWSSFPEYLKPTKRRVGWLRVDRLFGECEFWGQSRVLTHLSKI